MEDNIKYTINDFIKTNDEGETIYPLVCDKCDDISCLIRWNKENPFPRTCKHCGHIRIKETIPWTK